MKIFNFFKYFLRTYIRIENAYQSHKHNIPLFRNSEVRKISVRWNSITRKIDCVFYQAMFLMPWNRVAFTGVEVSAIELVYNRAILN